MHLLHELRAWHPTALPPAPTAWPQPCAPRPAAWPPRTVPRSPGGQPRHDTDRTWVLPWPSPGPAPVEDLRWRQRAPCSSGRRVRPPPEDVSPSGIVPGRLGSRSPSRSPSWGSTQRGPAWRGPASGWTSRSTTRHRLLFTVLPRPVAGGPQDDRLPTPHSHLRVPHAGMTCPGAPPPSPEGVETSARPNCPWVATAQGPPADALDELLDAGPRTNDPPPPCLPALTPAQTSHPRLHGGLSDRTNDTGEAARNALCCDRATQRRGWHRRPSARDAGRRRWPGGQPRPQGHERADRRAACPIVGPSPARWPSHPATGGPGRDRLAESGDHFDAVRRQGRHADPAQSQHRDNAGDYAQQLIGRGISRLAVALDVRNRAFSASWLDELRASYPALGGEILTVVEFHSAASTSFSDIADQLLDAAPGGCSSSRTRSRARLAQQVPSLADVPLAAVEWASTEQLLELGGRGRGPAGRPAHNRDDPGAGHRLPRTYRRASGANRAHRDATQAPDVLFDALARQSRPSPSSRDHRGRPLPGLQQDTASTFRRQHAEDHSPKSATAFVLVP